MRQSSMKRQRRWIGLGSVAFFSIAVYWLFFSAGMPVLWGPSASAKDIAAGRELFEHEWTPNDPLAHGDGLGPVFNAKSCVACHFQGGVGGGGEVMHNAMGFEVRPGRGSTEVMRGSIHNFSINPADKETAAMVRKRFPMRRGRTTTTTVTMENCPPSQSQTVIPDFDPVRTQTVQTTALFGVGWIDRISEKAIVQNFRNRSFTAVTKEMSLNFNTVPVGRVHTLADGRVGKFGWKAQTATLEEFVATACSNEIGLGTPTVAQSKPLSSPNAPDVAPDLDKKQFRALMAFVDTLPRPIEDTSSAAAKHGKELFAKIGCATCHVQDIGGVKGVYSDFLLYTLDDPTPPGGGGGPGGGYGPPPPVERPLPEEDVRPEEWKTQPLWGVADSAPYFHDGAATTLQDAILRHKGDAKIVSQAYSALSPADQTAVISFLNTLKAPPEATPVRDMAVTRLVKKK